MTGELVVRPTTVADVAAIVELARRSLGWAGDERDRAFFLWKHFENPFGSSPGWAAFDDGRLVAFRTMLRWELVSLHAGQLRLVRAVDTATHPDHQGRGLFRRLTLQAVGELATQGIDAVFNTPNDKSRPGYLKMGWSTLGRPTLMVQPRGSSAVLKLLRARVPAEKWSIPVAAGSPVQDVVDSVAVPHGRRADGGWSTQRTAAYLTWRYGFAPLHYRVVEVKGGHAIFRVRRRGPLTEVAFVEWLSEHPDPKAVRRLVKAHGDYGIALGVGVAHGFVPFPRQGPVVTWRALNPQHPPRLGHLDFSLGDLELF